MKSPYEVWRDKARRLLVAGVRPEHADWHGGLLNEPPPPSTGAPTPRVPAALVDLLERAACHRDGDKDGLLYRLLWRIVHEERGLLDDAADDDVMRVTRLARNVDRASHKMKAFVRFRELLTAEGVRYVARFAPEHDVLMRTAPFFVERFGTMDWTIATPDGIAHWDRSALAFLDADDSVEIPGEDAAEALWLAYYENIFNPARLNISLLQKEMPTRYWKHLPESQRIPTLVAAATQRTTEMIDRRVACGAGNIAARAAAPAKASSLQACRRCSLWERATQPVPGAGPLSAKLMLVGEQPGDEEDLAGKPFVGPAGRVLARALDEAGVDREQCYVTNAVKHFSFEPRGKRRIHKTPAQREVEACRIWLDEEIETRRPDVIVALGATSLAALMKKRIAVGSAREFPLAHPSGARVIATYHPSAVLRAADAQAAAVTYEALVYDLRSARALAGMVSPVATALARAETLRGR